MRDQKIKWAANKMPPAPNSREDIMAPEGLMEARAFHESVPGYEKTPLVPLLGMARELGLSGIWVKDESKRFGLNAFKVLGGLFAMAKVLTEKWGQDLTDTDFARLASLSEGREKTTFYTATDGNHGRGVAYAAARLNQRAVVLMPEGSSKHRFESIAALGAEVTIEPLNYDDCVRKAALLSEADPEGVLIQDTAWKGYEKIPSWIMRGYGTMVTEALEQLGPEPPTHVFVQAGVGSLAAAVQGVLLHALPENPPRLIVVECSAADCFYRSAEAADGMARSVSGRLDSIMAGLCCGQASTLAFDILGSHALAFVSCPDWVTAAGMRRLACPLAGDERVISGESGAVGLGLLAACAREEYRGLREALELSESSRVLLFSTEGDTDPERWRSIVWDGREPSI